MRRTVWRVSRLVSDDAKGNHQTVIQYRKLSPFLDTFRTFVEAVGLVPSIPRTCSWPDIHRPLIELNDTDLDCACQAHVSGVSGEQEMQTKVQDLRDSVSWLNGYYTLHCKAESAVQTNNCCKHETSGIIWIHHDAVLHSFAVCQYIVVLFCGRQKKLETMMRSRVC